MWPKGRTALLVVHGIGQQSPFDTLDAFVRGFWNELESSNQGSGISGVHHIRSLDARTENYISLLKDGAAATSIDCFEYYWAHETERQIDVGEVFDWLVKTGVAAQKYYDENQALADKYEGEGHAPFAKQYVVAGRSRFKKYWYLRQGGTALRIAQLLMSLIDPLVSRFPGVGKPIQWGLKLVGKVSKPFIVGAIGDIAIYTTTDMKSKHYEIRRRILEGAVRKLTSLVESTKPEYDRVIVVGHSLGSVIAYDTLNRLNHALNEGRVSPELAKKLQGLVTFGSPLDKTAFFFRERSQRHQYIRQQIIRHYHGFKAKDLSGGQAPPRTLDSDVKPMLDHIRWLNFWDPKDPISGPLDFYQIPDEDNRQLDMMARWGVAHSQYWSYGEMHRQILMDILCR